jgi:RimJ/RimL family protein N-acetyltransferase
LSPLRLVRHADAAGFLGRAQSWLCEREVEHGLLLGLGLACLAQPSLDVWLATVEADDAILGAALRTPPHNLVLGRLDDDGAASVLVAALKAEGAELPGATGPTPDVDKVAELWSDERAVAMEQHVYRCDRPLPVPAAPGRLRAALPEDAARLTAWAGPAAGAHLRRGEAFVWDHGGAVCMATAVGGTPNGIRVSGVFTPPELRGRGYATSCVAALTARQLERGRRFCFLYTDAANPTSNAIYERVGYERVCRSRMWKLGASRG